MSSLDPTRSLPPLKSFSLTHILYDPTHPLSIPLTLLSLTPIFLFVSYLTLLIFTRRLTIVFLALGSLSNETLNLVLKRIWRADRPWKGHGEVGEGYGMPSSHTQAAAFLVAWSIGYALTSERRYTQGTKASGRLALVRTVRKGIWVFGVVLWSILVAYSRWHLHYHSPVQILAGYSVGLLAGSTYFFLTEYLPLYHPTSLPGRIRGGLDYVWRGIGGVGGWQLGGAEGGWGEGWLLGSGSDAQGPSIEISGARIKKRA
ncbi:hypothetical protein EHS25_008173 [Saitozyma podzolica]|uniref:Phosphatidic acid phosphatase type 2/haloperoxidase domain-containing protein n=1 Tax=Saitozyma podzolica TaxID=1890683 RepID=A0A427YNT8_9TREE|nr:hypothetical protein EHS25_008173 [Saitozyma podzolica]